MYVVAGKPQKANLFFLNKPRKAGTIQKTFQLHGNEHKSLLLTRSSFPFKLFIPVSFKNQDPRVPEMCI